ncbi:hypothetical protein L873DRAFT_669067 [Choiromyces venosus 120613-1]|uniref:Uncharacterized protein n=1 Tax=Choiromyces venosus 120613-1 TaxID=1336337 RepID=A0A3N4JSC5_9PEZI|nr:hypothetical protein L873DRAFT_669067 [Choiromyces venosus 120613-1]
MHLSQTLMTHDLASGITAALTGIWITNEPRLYTFIFKCLFLQLGTEFVSQWDWVKITSSRGPIFHVESQARWPQSVLVFRWRRKSMGEEGVHRIAVEKLRAENALLTAT